MNAGKSHQLICICLKLEMYLSNFEMYFCSCRLWMRASPAILAGWGRYLAPLPPRSSSTRWLEKYFVCVSIVAPFFVLVLARKLMYKVARETLFQTISFKMLSFYCFFNISIYWYWHINIVKYLGLMARFTQWVTVRQLYLKWYSYDIDIDIDIYGYCKIW